MYDFKGVYMKHFKERKKAKDGVDNDTTTEYIYKSTFTYDYIKLNMK